MSVLDLVKPKAEPKYDRPLCLTMYGEDFDLPSSLVQPVYWQEPVLTEKDLIPDSNWKPRYQGQIIEPLTTYRQYRTNQF